MASEGTHSRIERMILEGKTRGELDRVKIPSRLRRKGVDTSEHPEYGEPDIPEKAADF